MVVAAQPNRSCTIEKYYALARRYGEDGLSCEDSELWEQIEHIRRCSVIGNALKKLLRVAHRAGQNSMRKAMTDMDKHFGSTAAICPRCGHRYKRHSTGGACPGKHRCAVTEAVQPVKDIYT